MAFEAQDRTRMGFDGADTFPFEPRKIFPILESRSVIELILSVQLLAMFFGPSTFQLLGYPVKFVQ